MRLARCIKPSGSAGEGSRALQRRGLHDWRDLGSCSACGWGALAFSLALYGVLGCRFVELNSASVDDGSVGGAGGGTRVGRGRMTGFEPGWMSIRHLGVGAS